MGKRKPEEPTEEVEQPETCGIVMPISACDGCDANHWGEVRAIINAAVEDAGFTPRIVSDANDAGVIQKRIVQNLFTDPIIVCDLSGKNSNVMFELGMRLAFDKPTVLIIDSETSFSFDVGVIEHLIYPRGLRHASIEVFKNKLTEKIKKTHTGGGESSFFKSFGPFKSAEPETTTVPEIEIVRDEMRELGRQMQHLVSSSIRQEREDAILKHARHRDVFRHSFSLQEFPPKIVHRLTYIIGLMPNVNAESLDITNGIISMTFIDEKTGSRTADEINGHIRLAREAISN